MLIRFCVLALVALTLAGCDKCGNFILGQAQVCRGELPKQQ
jgi:hypothetical protein